MVIRIGPTAAHPEGRNLTVARVRLDSATASPTTSVPSHDGVRDSDSVKIAGAPEPVTQTNESTAYQTLGAKAQMMSALTPEAGAERMVRLSLLEIEQGLGDFGISPTGEITSQNFSIPLESIEGSSD